MINREGRIGRSDRVMATSSITKNFVIRDDKTCEILAKALAEPRKKKEIKSLNYEQGKEKLKLYFGH